MLRKGITMLGDKWSAIYDKWAETKGKSFMEAHTQYLHNRMVGAKRLDSTFKKPKKLV